MAMEPASRNACAAPKPILFSHQFEIPDKTWNEIYPEVPPTTTTFLPTSFSADLTIVTVLLRIYSEIKLLTGGDDNDFQD